MAEPPERELVVPLRRSRGTGREAVPLFQEQAMADRPSLRPGSRHLNRRAACSLQAGERGLAMSVRAARVETSRPSAVSVRWRISVRTHLRQEDHMWRSKTVALFSAVSLLAATPAVPETSREAAEVVAARYARTCYVEMLDGQIKCGGRPRRTFAEARALLGPGTLAKAD